MKKSLIAIAFALASLTFAQSTPAPSQTPDQSTAPAKKAKKTTKKTSKKKTTDTSTTAAQK